jgi:hypothetical protein
MGIGEEEKRWGLGRRRRGDDGGSETRWRRKGYQMASEGKPAGLVRYRRRLGGLHGKWR